jgi:hypothetical protein
MFVGLCDFRRGDAVGSAGAATLQHALNNTSRMPFRIGEIIGGGMLFYQ